MHPERSNSIVRTVYPLAVYALLLVFTVNLWGPIESSEARYAEMAREMLQSGDWIHPTLLNIQHYDKPPLTYWITAVGYRLFGFSPVGFRVFLIVSLFAQIYLVYLLALSLMNDRRVAVLSAWVYGTMPLVLAAARGLTTDCYLNTFILAVMYSMLRWRATGKPLWLYATAIFYGLGFLTKGPLIFITPILFLIGFRKLLPRQPMRWHHLGALVVFVLVGMSWYLMLVMQDPRFLRYFVFHQTVDRVAHAEVFRRSEPFWYYLAFTPLAMLPWSVTLIGGFLRAPWKALPAVVRKLTLFLVLIPLLFFSSVSSKLMLYVLPIFPAAALLVAWFLTQLKNERKSAKSFYGYFLILVLGCYSIPFADPSFHFTWVLWALPMTTVGLLVWSYGPHVDGIVRGAGILTGFLIVFSALLMHTNELTVNGTKPLAAWIKENHLDDRTVLGYNQLLPSLAFNLDKDIVSLYDGNHYVRRDTEFETENSWRNTLFDLTKDSERRRLAAFLDRKPAIMVGKGSITAESQFLKGYFTHEHVEGKWTLFY